MRQLLIPTANIKQQRHRNHSRNALKTLSAPIIRMLVHQLMHLHVTLLGIVNLLLFLPPR